MKAGGYSLNQHGEPKKNCVHCHVSTKTLVKKEAHIKALKNSIAKKDRILQKAKTNAEKQRIAQETKHALEIKKAETQCIAHETALADLRTSKLEKMQQTNKDTCIDQDAVIAALKDRLEEKERIACEARNKAEKENIAREAAHVALKQSMAEKQRIAESDHSKAEMEHIARGAALGASLNALKQSMAEKEQRLQWHRSSTRLAQEEKLDALGEIEEEKQRITREATKAAQELDALVQSMGEKHRITEEALTARRAEIDLLKKSMDEKVRVAQGATLALKKSEEEKERIQCQAKSRAAEERIGWEAKIAALKKTIAETQRIAEGETLAALTALNALKQSMGEKEQRLQWHRSSARLAQEAKHIASGESEAEKKRIACEATTAAKQQVAREAELATLIQRMEEKQRITEEALTAREAELGSLKKSMVEQVGIIQEALAGFKKKSEEEKERIQCQAMSRAAEERIGWEAKIAALKKSMAETQRIAEEETLVALTAGQKAADGALEAVRVAEVAATAHKAADDLAAKTAVALTEATAAKTAAEDVAAKKAKEEQDAEKHAETRTREITRPRFSSGTYKVMAQLQVKKMKAFHKHLGELQKLTEKKIGSQCPDIEIHLEKQIVKLNKHVHFKSGTDNVLPESISMLKQVAFALKTVHEIIREKGKDLQLKQLYFEVQGHTHSVDPSMAANKGQMRRSSGRALAVMNFLKTNEVVDKYLSHKGFGGTRPVEGGTPKDNRRVEIALLDPRDDNEIGDDS